jgi:hypothetical protein
VFLEEDLYSSRVFEFMSWRTRIGGSRWPNAVKILNFGTLLLIAFQTVINSAEPVEGSHRLTNGTVPREGRVEIYTSGSWRGVCLHSMNTSTANAICSDAGFGAAVQVLVGAVFGVSSSCGVGQQSALVCSGPNTSDTIGLVRFAHFNTSEGYATGHPEVATSAGYALFCSVDNTSLAQLGTVLCRSMGFSSVTSSQTSSIEGSEDAELKWVTRANCTGSERNIKGCSLEVGSTCPSRLAVSVQCSGASEAVPSLGPAVEGVRLAGGGVEREGRVEFLRKGVWQAVCNHNWNWVVSDVVCGYLGLGYAVGRYAGTLYGRSNSTLPLSPPLFCRNSSQLINDCLELIPDSPSDCSEISEVGLVCAGRNTALSNGDVRLSHSTALYSGRVEVYSNSRWYHARHGRSEWTSGGASVACRAMGFNTVINSSYPAVVSSSAYCFTSSSCSGDEFNFQSCFNSLTDCHLATEPDVGVQCGGILDSIQQPPPPPPTTTPTLATTRNPTPSASSGTTFILGVVLGIAMFLLVCLVVFFAIVFVILCALRKKQKSRNEYDLTFSS